MIQIGLLIFSAALFIRGLISMMGKEGNNTHPAVAIATMIVAAGLAGFALVGLPLLMYL